MLGWVLGLVGDGRTQGWESRAVRWQGHLSASLVCPALERIFVFFSKTEEVVSRAKELTEMALDEMSKFPVATVASLLLPAEHPLVVKEQKDMADKAG